MEHSVTSRRLSPPFNAIDSFHQPHQLLSVVSSVAACAACFLGDRYVRVAMRSVFALTDASFISLGKEAFIGLKAKRVQK